MILADLISSASQNDTPAVLSIFGLFVAGTFSTAAIMLRTSARRDKAAEEAAKADRKERNELIKTFKGLNKSMDKVADSNKDIAVATIRGADEAKQRNGHLAELVIKNTGDIVKAVNTHHDQTVETMHVQKQVIQKGKK